MEITRDERLREMGLSPVWKRRAELIAQTPAAVPDATQAPVAATAAVSLSVAPARVAIDTTMRARPKVEADAKPPSVRALEISALGWDQLAPHIAGCTACALCRSRRQTVPGVGAATAGWMFVGEAPGGEEDAQGEPFVGQAGRLLDNMLKSIRLSREDDVYITNVIKCRPPNNRNPEPAEVAQCSPYLERQIELIKPRLIVALGKFAAVTLLGAEATVASLRGKVHTYRGVSLIVTYHPAYLLRSLPEKARAWEDLLLAKRTFEALQSESAVPT